MSKIDEMRSGFETAYIDGAVASGSTYRPRFVSNNYKKGNAELADKTWLRKYLSVYEPRYLYERKYGCTA